ncbi:DUF1841 family protein [Burkholderiaceae bacterium FT117]|uniref:DUF1841 family protein n=1 Tax=Zeimonas sediminis TaxID=2944268 RepID=UPI002342DB44|nr:DUF1841 family protein [Zeimonas sediminis]MCM5572173.1 DUF1841 family protein [Zeimonas sediminis]
MFDPSRDDVRRFFCEAWRKQREALPLTPLETIAADWIVEHPEYHPDLESLERALAAEYPVEGGRSNPFLHLAMHLSISEQVQIDQPPGIRAAHDALARRLDSRHEAAHRIMECLGETIWRAQRDRTTPDAQAYLECIRRQAG